jgi:hypothetical protein
MADNIKIIGNIDDIQRVNRFKLEDLNLLSSQTKNQIFGFENDYIEYFIYDAGGNLINNNYNYKNFKLPSDSFLTPGSNLPIIEIDPVNDLQTLGYISGEFKTQYNFQTKKISSPEAELFISQISEDRTEIRISSTIISSTELLDYGNKLINELDSSLEQKYFLLNFNNNTQFLVVNVAVDVTDSSILLKLYEPLPQIIQTKLTVWVTEEIIEPYVFNLNLDTSIIPESAPQLKGPNFEINIDLKQNVGTKYENYSSLVSSLTGSSYRQVLNYMNDGSYDLNIDYTSFDNFVNFSSAEKRLNIFYNKVKQIETFNNEISIINSSTNVLKNEQTSSIKLKIDDIVKNFDGFENYMYYESSSYAWPKSGVNKPFTLLSTGSLTSQTWYNNYTGSAEIFDENNLDRLYNIIPNYIKNDPDNYQSYYDFVDMIGHYFDNIWIYITSINELYNADNNLEKGISKDIVYDALRSLGVKLYNSKGDDDFNDYIGGLNSGSTLFTDDFSVTSSYLNNVPKKDQLAELYKRIYHNIPLLSKTKGTSTGLKNLITSFGVTSSIFSPKEFGGSTKKNEIKGYDNDKITIKNNTITGSVLSPFISLQQNTTSSSEFTSTDLHFVDLSFSPQNQLNQRLSSSIALTNPTFSLDQYIGDPRLMASSSYNDLINQNNYFTSASSAISGSAKRLDYKGFFELIKYFDNSLFKMLKDFIPARSNALTGITIKSPILERNKIAVHQPKITEQQVFEAGYEGPTIQEDKSYYYDVISGDKSSFYSGQLTGSYFNINDYFENSNPNPYLHPTTSINLNEFNHTDFNVTLNNVSSSIPSISRQKLETKYITSNSKVFSSGSDITSIAELQDSNLSLLGYNNSRYNGTKLTSLKYNTYSSSSLTYGGDTSFGKTAVIDKYTRKIGLFTQINPNPYLGVPQRNNVSLTYLVDESGSLTELNKRNKHWVELQNIFKTGEELTVALFDNQKFSNQKSTDGDKLIFNSGYSYSPIIYAGSTDSKIYFDYTGDSISRLFRITTTSDGYISGSTSLKYPIELGKINKLFEKNTDTPDPLYSDGNLYYNTGSSASSFSTYSIQETGNQQFNASFTVRVDFASTNQSGSFTFNINKVGTGNISTQTLPAASGYTSTVYTSLNFAKKIGTPLTLSSDLKVYDGSGTYIETISSGTTLYQVYAGAYTDSSCNIYGGGTYYVTSAYYSSIGSLYGSCIDVYTLPSFDKKLYNTPSNNLTSYLNFNLSTPYQEFTLGNEVGFEFVTGSGGFTTNNFTASVLSGGQLYNQLSTNQAGSNPYATSSVSPFISGSDGNKTIILNSELSYFHGYQFVPSGSVLGNLSSLYSSYGDINYQFSPKSGDIVILYYGGTGNFIESNIDVIVELNNKLYITLSSDLPSSLTIPAYSNSTVDKFLILNKVNDETNTILKFNKKEGNTSLGFIIPNNLHPDVLNNIDTITKEVKQKLIDFGSPSGSI